jgi:thioredoxin 1
MATVELTESSFADTIKQSPIVYEKAALANTDIVFAKVDTEAEQGLAGSFEISSIPTLMAIRDGVVLYSQAGALPQEGLDNLISAIRAVDMEQVRTEIAKASDEATQD